MSVCQTLLLDKKMWVHLLQHLSLFFRASASLNLERQINKVDGLVSGFEKNLSEDGPIPDVSNAIPAHADNIQVRKGSI